MKMPHNILVVISGKQKEHEALERALTFAKNNTIHIHLLNVMFEPVLEMIDVFSIEHRQEMKRQYLADRHLYMDSIAGEVVKKGINCSVRVEWCRDIHEAIEEVVNELQPDLVIKRISAEHLSINPFALPIDRYLLRYCNAPLLLVKHSNWTTFPVLAAVDVQAEDEQHIALNKAIIESADFMSHLSGSELHTVSVHTIYSLSAAIDVPNIDINSINANSADYHQQKLDKLVGEYKVNATKNHVIGGLPEHEIPNMTKQIDAQLVVIGTVTRKGIAAAFMGNTVESVLAELNCEVLALKPKN